MKVNLEMRLCKVGDEIGYFHCFEQWANVVEASPLIGGHPAGQISQIHGIVEFADGVKRIDPTRIKFIDEENHRLYLMKNSSKGDDWYDIR